MVAATAAQRQPVATAVMAAAGSAAGGSDEHDRRRQQERGAHQRNDGPGLERLGHAIVVESAAPEEHVLPVRDTT
jgi:hypothetical protein